MKERNSLHIHVARWVIPVASPPIEGGAVATFGGKIVAVGAASEVRSSYLGEVKDHGDSILCPGLINAHSHLELSPLKWRLTPSGSFVAWVRTLIAAREKTTHGETTRAIDAAIKDLVAGGVVAIGDVGNLDFVPFLSAENRETWPLGGVFFKELIDPGADQPPEFRLDGPASVHGENPGHTFGPGPGFHYAFSAHAPYSVSPPLLMAIKQWDRINALPFSIHVAESREETEFMHSGKGHLRDFMEEKGHWYPKFGLPGRSPVRYLDSMDVLDRDTVCVHCVQVDKDDILILAESGASVCLCPRSNVFLGVGAPPAEAMQAAGVNLALGTDSLASNDRLSIFAEMASLAGLSPGLPANAIFMAATLGGARALGIDDNWGTLTPGKAATFLVVEAGALCAKDVLEFLVHKAYDDRVECYLTGEGE
jgi:cytosine/adenosine deaminase-related metal-dependent hydrolase